MAHVWDDVYIDLAHIQAFVYIKTSPVSGKMKGGKFSGTSIQIDRLTDLDFKTP